MCMFLFFGIVTAPRCIILKLDLLPLAELVTNDFIIFFTVTTDEWDFTKQISSAANILDENLGIHQNEDSLTGKYCTKQ